MLAPLLIYYEHFVREDRSATGFGVKVKRYLPGCLAAVGYVALRITLLGKLAPVLQHAQISWPQAIYSGFALVGEYARLMFWPTRLSAFHVFHASHSLAESRVVWGLGVIVVCGVLALLLHKRSPVASFCIVWAAITLAPVLNARWMAANVLTERYLYLPSVGICWLAGWAAKQIWDWAGAKGQRRTGLRVATVTAGVALLALGTAKTWARNNVWNNDRVLYTETLKTDPDSFVMHMNLGVSYFDTDSKASEKEFLRALELRPNSPNALNGLGCVYMEQDRYAEAEATLKRAIAEKPTWTDPHFNYGRLLKKTGRNDAALSEFQKAVEMGPANATARLYLAEELEERGRIGEAEAQYRESIQLSPSASLKAQQNLTDLLLKSGRDEEAITMMERMAVDYPFDSTTHLKLARSYEKQGRIREAERDYQRTLETDPANAEAKEALRRLRTPAS
jgi:tetratricopeptide (TPR) repeat protein